MLNSRNHYIVHEPFHIFGYVCEGTMIHQRTMIVLQPVSIMLRKIMCWLQTKTYTGLSLGVGEIDKLLKWSGRITLDLCKKWVKNFPLYINNKKRSFKSNNLSLNDQNLKEDTLIKSPSARTSLIINSSWTVRRLCGVKWKVK